MELGGLAVVRSHSESRFRKLNTGDNMNKYSYQRVSFRRIVVVVMIWAV